MHNIEVIEALHAILDKVAKVHYGDYRNTIIRSVFEFKGAFFGRVRTMCACLITQFSLQYTRVVHRKIHRRTVSICVYERGKLNFSTVLLIISNKTFSASFMRAKLPREAIRLYSRY